jgi:hypothetical protein
MSSYNESQVKTYTATAVALDAYVRVKKSGANVAVAGAGEVAIGVTLANCAASGKVPVLLFNGVGTALIKAGGAITAGAAVYGIADGKIDDTGTGAPVGYAEEAATADGDVIEVLLLGRIPYSTAASAAQAVPTDLATAIAWITNVRLALIADGTIKGSA